MSYQVNNLKVRLNISTNKWIVITLDGRILEEFRFEPADAIRMLYYSLKIPMTS
ncbi:hypothetical protein LCGC14_1215310 [marine sediment metagenome]|uniref:Uncharacterized protein n=1 Tax=marine sediment metagenome TaxID=412755 RepID=A0A0F9LD43_9ZZZZ